MKDMRIVSLEKFIDKTLELLEVEKREEIESIEESRKSKSSEELEKAGLRLRSLIVHKVEAGLCGRTIVTLLPPLHREGRLPSNLFSAGSTVSIQRGASTDDEEDKDVQGLVYRISVSQIQIVLDNSDKYELLGKKVTVDLLTNQVKSFFLFGRKKNTTLFIR